jgi:hypothetical protein
MRFWEIPSFKSNLEKKHNLYINKLSEIDERFAFRIKKTIGLEFQRVNREQNNSVYLYMQLVPIAILEIFFVAYGIILWSIDTGFHFAKPEKITIRDEKDNYSYFAQGIFFPLAWTLLISYTLLLIWYQKFRTKKFVMDWRLFILLIVAFVIILIWAILYSVLVLKDCTTETQILVTTAFVIATYCFFTGAMFYGYFQSNGHNFYYRNRFDVLVDIEQKKKQFEKEKAKRIEKLIEEEKLEEYVSKRNRNQSMQNSSMVSESFESYDGNQYYNEDEEESKYLNKSNKRTIGSPRIKDNKYPEIQWVDTPKSISESIQNNEIHEASQQLDEINNANEQVQMSLFQRVINQLMPKETNDWITVSLFWSNIISLFIFMIINVSIYDEVWIPLVSFFWALILELGFLGLNKYYYSRYDYKKLWFLVWAIIIWVIYIASLITFIVTASENKISYAKRVIATMLILHIAVYLSISIYFLLYLPYKELPRDDKFQQFRKILLISLVILFFVVFGIVLMAVWNLWAMAAGSYTCAWLILWYTILGIPQIKQKIGSERKKKIIFLIFTIIITLVITIVLAAIANYIEADFEDVILEILSFIIYLSIAYTFANFMIENAANKRNKRNEIYIYSDKLMPMLRFKSIKFKALGKMIENNNEYFFFFATSVLYMTWSLLAGLILNNESKYIGYSFSALGMVLIYFYIETRIQEGKSMGKKKLYTIHRNYFDDLFAQAKQMRLNNDNLTLNNLEQELMEDTSEHEGENQNSAPVHHNISERAYFNIVYLEWSKLFKDLKRRCNNLFMGGPNPEFNNPEIIRIFHEFWHISTFQQKVEIMNKVGRRYDQEYFNYLWYKAYMKGMINLKCQHYKEELVAAVENLLRDVKDLLKEECDIERVRHSDSNLTHNTEYSKYVEEMIPEKKFSDEMTQEEIEEFNRIFAKFLELDMRRLQEKLNEENKEQERIDIREQRKYRLIYEIDDSKLEDISDSDSEERKSIRDPPKKKIAKNQPHLKNTIKRQMDNLIGTSKCLLFKN